MSIRNALNYRKLLQSLLPKGSAWNRNEGSVLTEFLYGQAEEFARVDNRSVDLLNERDTRLSSELLIDHEIDLGLPDDCSPAEQTIQERRLAAHARLIALGQQSPAYFIEIAAAAGWTIIITEFSPFFCGFGGSGGGCGGPETIFYWEVITNVAAEITTTYFLCGSSESGDLLSFLSQIHPLQCLLERYKPAHTKIIFSLKGIEFNVEYNSAFDSIVSTEEAYLIGAFSQSFGLGFDGNWGGDFVKDDFGLGYKQPS